jgi:hypothetical protein
MRRSFDLLACEYLHQRVDAATFIKAFSARRAGFDGAGGFNGVRGGTGVSGRKMAG